MLKIFNICLPQIINKINFKRHLKIALFVGTILNFINQYEIIIKMDYHKLNITRLLITYCVPFLVSVYSAATFNHQETKI
jgi:hypothetical protein